MKRKIICYFGSYQEDYSRNKIFIQGLIKNGYMIKKCHVAKPSFRTDSKLMLMIYILLSPFYFLYRNFQLIFKGYRLFQNGGFNLIFVGYPSSIDLPAAFLLKKMLNVPVIFDSLTSFYDTFVLDRKLININLLAKVFYFTERNFYKIPDLILVDTKANMKFLTHTFKIPKNKIAVVYLGAEENLYKPKKLKNKKLFNIIFYGYSSPLHGTEYILKAAAICQKKINDIKFILLGDGQTRNRDLKLAKELQLNNIKFLPSMKEVKAAMIIREADVILGVFKGNNKSKRVIPNKVYQGIAMAKPVVTEESEAINEIFQDRKNILVCKPANEMSLANSILLLKRNKKLRENISSNAYKLYLEKFTSLKVGQDLSRIIETI